MNAGSLKPADRLLQVLSLTADFAMSDSKFDRGFVALIPAFTREDEDVARAVVPSLVRGGCIEVCCVGPRAEVVHDEIDCVVEDLSALHVVTTWDEHVAEGVEYFLQWAGGGAMQLLGLVAGHETVRRPLITMASAWGIKSVGESMKAHES